ncbi:hypothetical protein F0562_031045 [Nyssa sinensis]|uniref:peroxidase n=1 Tax=Nyssa sinensis TaxID=561372 RepID=A0A5J5AX44_9ASTE|nr:hypothetical protein F0562_031045 [Nyssa sinensis]
MSSRKLTCVSITLIFVLWQCVELEAELQVGFYRTSCSMAEFIVKEEVREGFIGDKGVAAGLVRMHFHDCFVRVRGFGYDVPAGRRDGRISLASEAFTNLPFPTFNINQLTGSFANKGFAQEEMVTLSGAHTIGHSHCTSFSNSTSPNLVVPMNPTSPSITDVGYYMDVLANRGLFTSDQALLTNPATANLVNQYARNPLLWKSRFAAAMEKMGQIGVLTGTAGEIRANCRVINS